MNKERYLCLLRGINVSGHKKLPMAALREIFANNGCENVQSYLQSGNVVFEASPDSANPEMISGILKQETGHEITVFIYSIDQYNEIITAEPFGHDSRYDPKWRHLTFLGKKPTSSPQKHFQMDNGDEARYAKGHYFVYCPNGYGRTKLNNRFFEQHSGVAATTRNWKTVSNLKEMLNAQG